MPLVTHWDPTEALVLGAHASPRARDLTIMLLDEMREVERARGDACGPRTSVPFDYQWVTKGMVYYTASRFDEVLRPSRSHLAILGCLES